MSEIVRSTAKAFRACVTYERLQKTSIDSAYQSVCYHIRWDLSPLQFMAAIGMSRYDFINKSTKKQLIESLRTDPISIHYCTIYEFIQKKPLGQAYKSICTVFGSDVITYDDMKNRFENFKNGRFEENGGSNGNRGDSLPNISNKKVFEQFEIIFSDQSTVIHIGSDVHMGYCQLNDQCLVNCTEGQTFVRNRDYLEMSLHALRPFLNDPHVEIGDFMVRFKLGMPFSKILTKRSPVQVLEIIEDFFKGLPYPLHVKSLDIECIVLAENAEPLSSILPYLKPGVLEKLRIRIGTNYGEMMEKAIETDQWKQAAELDMQKVPFGSPMESLWNFKKFQVFLPNLTEKDVVEMKETLFKIATFESCVVEYPKDQLDISRIEKRRSHVEDRESGLNLYKSQHTNAIYSIQVLDDVIEIDKQ